MPRGTSKGLLQSMKELVATTTGKVGMGIVVVALVSERVID